MRNLVFLFLWILFFSLSTTAQTPQEVSRKLEEELVSKYGEAQREQIARGIRQVASYWRAEDGNVTEFEEFIRAQYLGDPEARETTFQRLEYAFEQILGYMSEISLELRKQTDLDLGPLLPIDQLLAGYNPSAHLSDDFFQNKLAFVVLLNYPLTTLEERLTQGEKWSRKQWAQARLASQFSSRLPAEVNLEMTKALSAADQYISEYNIWMHHLLDEEGNRLFPPKLRLISHWNLRDELKANYFEKNGLPKQRMIQKVMERIVTQTIPRVVINNPHVDWKPESNQVMPSVVKDTDTPPPPEMKIMADPEPNTRYHHLLSTFRAARMADPYSPIAPTLIARRFNESRELPEERVKQMLEKILASPLVPRVAALIEKRLGRSLEPFDIWYNGFKPRGQYTEAELDAITKKKYPTAEAYAADIPNILQKLDFSRERAQWIADHIIVEPSRGAGHAWGAERRGEKAHLRTRVEKDGMNYKGYNIAVHEMGHNVEQTISLYEIDHWFLRGVPNTAFTEAIAFVFQDRDLELLGLTRPDFTSEALAVLDDFWSTYEISGVALVDMEVWHWMYKHPDATPDQLKEATVRIAKEIWNRFYAPVFKQKDVVLLGIYSHMIDSLLYLPDYPIGHMIAFQIKEQVQKAGKMGPEIERMAKIGAIVPDLWMKQATGSPVGPEALLRATEKALQQLQ